MCHLISQEPDSIRVDRSWKPRSRRCKQCCAVRTVLCAPKLLQEGRHALSASARGLSIGRDTLFQQACHRRPRCAHVAHEGANARDALCYLAELPNTMRRHAMHTVQSQGRATEELAELFGDVPTRMVSGGHRAPVCTCCLHQFGCSPMNCVFGVFIICSDDRLGF